MAFGSIKRWDCQDKLRLDTAERVRVGICTDIAFPILGRRELGASIFIPDYDETSIFLRLT